MEIHASGDLKSSEGARCSRDASQYYRRENLSRDRNMIWTFERT